MLVIFGVDQLHVHAHAIADPADAAFQECGHAKRLADFAGAARAARLDTT